MWLSGFRRALERWNPRRGQGAATPIGFDLGIDGLHTVQMEGGAGWPRIRSALSLPYPGGRESVLDSPPALRSLVADARRRGRLRGRRVVTALPTSELKLMVLGYHPESEEREAEALLQLVRERVGGDLAEYVVDHLPIRLTPESRGERSSLVAVARRSEVVRYLELLRQAGLEVVALEIPASAVMRAVHWLQRGDTRRNSLILQCGREGCELIVLWGRRLVLCRQVDFGEDQLVEDLRKSLDLSPESAAEVLLGYGVFAGGPAVRPGAEPEGGLEIRQTVEEILRPAFGALASQVNDALVYTASRTRGATIDEVCLLGRFGYWPGVEALLQQILGVPVRLLDLTEELGASGEARPGPPTEQIRELVVAAGLALRGMVGGS